MSDESPRSMEKRKLKRTTMAWPPLPPPTRLLDDVSPRSTNECRSPRAEISLSLPIAKRAKDVQPSPPPDNNHSLISEGRTPPPVCAPVWPLAPPPVLRRRLTPRMSWSQLIESQEDISMMASSPITERRQSKHTIASAAYANWSSDPMVTPVASDDAAPSFALQGGASSSCMSPRVPVRAGSFCIGSPPARPTKPMFPPKLPRNGSGLSLLSDGDEGTERFAKEFEGARVIGSGNFAVVYRARHRIDKQEYAIKKTKNPIARGADRRREMLHEALALASVANDSPCPYIVRYFGAWIEDDRLYIQTELCDESLKDLMLALCRSRPHDPRHTEDELLAVMRDVSMGLAVLHGRNLVHLDIKPENVLVKRATPSPSRDLSASSRTHKIADLGLATAAIGSGCDEINEGDSRYLARELLQGDFSDLTKADVFSLGLMLYELATNPKGLPVNGDEWHRLRDGFVEESFCSHLSSELLALIHKMVHPVAAVRPPCADILLDPIANPQKLSVEDSAIMEELQRQLRQTREIAEREKQMRASAEKKIASAEEKADRYWMELKHLKKQEWLNGCGKDAPQETPVVRPSASPQPQRCWRRSNTA